MKKRNHKILRVAAVALLSVIALIIGGILFVTFWLTPDRLSEIVEKEASQRLDADVEVSGVRFTFWSSFPRLILESDSLRVVSRSLDPLPDSDKRRLPEGYQNLLSARNFCAELNVGALLGGRIEIDDLSLCGLSLNLVSFSDTVANWLIFPTRVGKRIPIPETAIGKMKIDAQRGVSYVDVASGLRLKSDSLRLLLSRCLRSEKEDSEGEASGDEYKIETSGDISLDYKSRNMFSGFPVRLKGEIGVDFHPFRVSFSDMGIWLANMRGNASLDMEVEGQLKFESFSLSLDAFRLMRMRKYMAGNILPEIPDSVLDPVINVAINLAKPYCVGKESLPSFSLDFQIPGNSIFLPLKSGMIIPLNYSDMSMRMDFNGDAPADSRISISPIEISGADAKLRIGAKVDNPFGKPKIETNLALSAFTGGKSGGINDIFPGLRKLKANGGGDLKLRLSFSLPSVSDFEPEDVRLEGKLHVDQFRINTEVDGHSDLHVKNLDLIVKGNGCMMGERISFKTPVAYDLSAGRASWRSGSTRLETSGLSASGATKLMTPTEIFNSLTAGLKASEFRLTAPGHRLDVSGLEVSGSFARRQKKVEERIASLEKGYPDSLWLARSPHTPLYLSMHSKGMAKFVRNWKLSSNVGIRSAEWKADNYPHPFRMDKADLWTDFDSVSIRSMRLSSGNSDMALSGRASGLRPFFMSAPSAPVETHLDIQAGTIDINQIARATVRPDSASVKEDTQDKGSPAWLIPRNLDAHISLQGRKVEYVNLDLTDIEGEARIQGGRLTLPSLNLATTFAHLGLNIGYDTSDIADMSLQASVNLDDIALEPLYGKFKSLTARLPQIRNLSGFASVGGAVRFVITPKMAVDMASMSADLKVVGRKLELRQDPFIRRVTRMLLLPGNRPIGISDIEVRVGVRDNLLELFPVELDFGQYRIEAEGVNNFAGDLDYHLGIRHSPIPFPFGIDIGGRYGHPKVRFGGAKWNPDGAWRVTSRITKSYSWDFAGKIRWAGKELLKKAATSETL